jgi:hypothetical protein
MPSKRNKFSNKDVGAPAFSEANCGLATTEYYQSLARQGPKYTMDTIAMVRQRQETIQKLKDAPAEDLKPKGGRALLCMYFSLVACSTTTNLSDIGRILAVCSIPCSLRLPSTIYTLIHPRCNPPAPTPII